MSIPEEIKKYKELLDNNIITQEEFDKKKKELLEKNEIHSANNTNTTLENIDELQNKILNEVKKYLKCPSTATLCNLEDLKITTKDDMYVIKGYVNSQNSYGAMLSTDFSISATYENNMWIVKTPIMGFKNAIQYGTSFAINYIGISIVAGIITLISMAFWGL